MLRFAPGAWSLTARNADPRVWCCTCFGPDTWKAAPVSTACCPLLCPQHPIGVQGKFSAHCSGWKRLSQHAGRYRHGHGQGPIATNWLQLSSAKAAPSAASPLNAAHVRRHACPVDNYPYGTGTSYVVSTVLPSQQPIKYGPNALTPYNTTSGSATCTHQYTGSLHLPILSITLPARMARVEGSTGTVFAHVHSKPARWAARVAPLWALC